MSQRGRRGGHRLRLRQAGAEVPHHRPDAVDPDDVEMLEDMIVAAVNEALRAAESDAASNMQKLTGGLGLPF